MSPTTPAWLAIACLVTIHLAAGKLRFLRVLPRSRWLSIAGGVSVAYAFVRLLPELSQHQDVLQEAGGSALAFLEHHAYLVALGGLATFYGIERATKTSRQRGGKDGAPSTGVFWLSIASFGMYNAVIGYLILAETRRDLGSLAFFTLAMGVHFIVNDFGLQDHHRETYTRWGRWLISLAVIVGGAVGGQLEIPPPALALLVAFLTGGIILNVLKEELPEERESRFGAFMFGLFGYSALLVSF